MYVKLDMENLTNGQVAAKVNGFADAEIDLEFLPLIYEIIKSVERDPTHDSSQKTRETQDAAHKILELEKKLIQAREQINRLPGIEHSQEEQLRQVDNLRKQLALKRQLLKLSNTYPIRRAARYFAFLAQKYHRALLSSGFGQKIGQDLLRKIKEIK